MLRLGQRYLANFFNDRVTVETNELEQLIKDKQENITIFNASYALPSFNPRIEHIR
jgi:hypothetical protein